MEFFLPDCKTSLEYAAGLSLRCGRALFDSLSE
jgi:hypothetical protein